MTDYTIRFTRVPNDVPVDVLIEHLAVAARKINKERKAFRKVGVELVSATPTKAGRKHPFDGPEVNDDLPLAEGGFTSGKTSTSMIAGDAGYVVPKGAITTWTGGVSIFTGPNREEWADTGIVAKVPEEAEVEIIEVDLDDIVSQVYRAIGEDFPRLAELFKAKREERELHRATDATEPPAEGDWELDGDDKVGEDL